MSDFDIIQRVTRTFCGLIEEQSKQEGLKGVSVVPLAPVESALEKSRPCISVYLYHIDENQELKEREPEKIREHDKDGILYDFIRQAPIKLNLKYIISSWSKDPEDEQMMLGKAVQTIHDYPNLIEAGLGKEEPEDDSTISLRLLPLTRSDLAEFWVAMGQPVRPAIQCQVVVHIDSKRKRRYRRVEERVLDIHQKEN